MKQPDNCLIMENFDYANGLDPVVKAIHAVAEKPILKTLSGSSIRRTTFLKPAATAADGMKNAGASRTGSKAPTVWT